MLVFSIVLSNYLVFLTIYIRKEMVRKSVSTVSVSNQIATLVLLDILFICVFSVTEYEGFIQLFISFKLQRTILS